MKIQLCHKKQGDDQVYFLSGLSLGEGLRHFNGYMRNNDQYSVVYFKKFVGGEYVMFKCLKGFGE